MGSRRTEGERMKSHSAADAKRMVRSLSPHPSPIRVLKDRTKASSLKIYSVIVKVYLRHRKTYPLLAKGTVGNDEGERERELQVIRLSRRQNGKLAGTPCRLGRPMDDRTYGLHPTFFGNHRLNSPTTISWVRGWPLGWAKIGPGSS